MHIASSADQDHWLYVAELVIQGSDYPDGRHRFAVPIEVDSARYNCVNQSNTPSSTDSTLADEFESMNLDDFKDIGHSSEFPPLPMASGQSNAYSIDRTARSNDCGDNNVLGMIVHVALSVDIFVILTLYVNFSEFSSQKNGCWDVAVFKIVCKIKPTDQNWIQFEYPSPKSSAVVATDHDGKKSVLKPNSAKSYIGPPTSHVARRDLVPMRGAHKIPEVEQTMRLISYQGTQRKLNRTLLSRPDVSNMMLSLQLGMARSPSGTISVCWGTVNMILFKQLLINFYSDFGSSGGAVVDCEGNLVGLISNSILKIKPTAYVEPLYPLLNLLRSGLILKRSCASQSSSY